jgi:transcriptional regulator with XRE-family HTH domain
MSTMTDEVAKANIAANIRRLLAMRKAPENQQKWLAEESGESEMRISLYVRGERMASAGVLTRIADALGVSIDELIDDPPPQNGRRKKSA